MQSGVDESEFHDVSRLLSLCVRLVANGSVMRVHTVVAVLILLTLVLVLSFQTEKLGGGSAFDPNSVPRETKPPSLLDVVRRLANSPPPQHRCVWSNAAAANTSLYRVLELAQRSHLHYRKRNPLWVSPVAYRRDMEEAAAASRGEWAVVPLADSPLKEAGSSSASVFAPPIYFGPLRLSNETQNGMLLPAFGLWQTMLFSDVRKILTLEPNVSVPQLVGCHPVPYFIVAAMGVMNGYDAVTCDGHVLTSGGCKPVATVNKRMLRDPQTGREPPLLDRVAVFLHNPYPTNLYHLYVEILPRLETVAAVLADAELHAVLVVPYINNNIPICQRIVEFITIVFGVPKDRMTHLLNGQLAARAVVVPMPAPCLDQHPALLHRLRQRAMLHMPAGNSRRNHSLGLMDVVVVGLAVREGSRVMRNFAEVKDRIAALHLRGGGPRLEIQLVPTTIVKTHTFLEQAAMFHSFDILFGAHGANLANLMWMRRGAHVIEVMSGPDGNMCYFRLCGHLGLVHHLLLHSGGKQSAFAVDVNEVMMHVESAVEHIVAARRRAIL